MKNETIVVALGGNALQLQGEAPTITNQIKNIRVAVAGIMELIKEDYNVVITHGNGPQIGRLLLQNAKADDAETPAFPFDVCSAMSQALIGYHIQQVLENELKLNKISKGVVTVITQVEVDSEDAAFKAPTKPIGPFYSEKEAEEIEKEKGYVMREDAGRGFRQVVASPQPKSILELSSIEDLIEDNIVICCGGGGIPVISDNGNYRGVPAVIDKDRASSLLAKDIKADRLVILTAVSEVAIAYGTENQKSLHEVTVSELRGYMTQNEFAAGSMLPKVEATIDFVEATGNEAIITTLDNIGDALQSREVGTIIKK